MHLLLARQERTLLLHSALRWLDRVLHLLPRATAVGERERRVQVEAVAVLQDWVQPAALQWLQVSLRWALPALASL